MLSRFDLVVIKLLVNSLNLPEAIISLNTASLGQMRRELQQARFERSEINQATGSDVELLRESILNTTIDFILQYLQIIADAEFSDELSESDWLQLIAVNQVEQ